MSAWGPARGASGLRESGSGAAGGEDDGERRQSVRPCVPPLTIVIGGDAMVVEKTGDAMVCEKTGAWTGTKKAKVQCAPTSEGVDMTAPVISTPEQGVEGFDWKQVEGFDWTYADVKEEVDSFQKYRGLPNLDDDFWILNDDQQTEELRKRLAICHIRAHKGAGLNDAQLLSILEQDGPFRPYEHPPKWMFDVERFKISGFQDYQRLIPVESYDYHDWSHYYNAFSTLESDQQFVCLWEKLFDKTKWLQHCHKLTRQEWRIVDRVTFYHAAKIKADYPQIYSMLLIDFTSVIILSPRHINVLDIAS
ncbi:hypothetical protein BDA96_01G043700 [Sorghum bicolor]|uniref:Uncharacterized protein n=1 Tax=Sorghum bicolor TaxID=4558 RepID=A0A921RXH8_SORBI|nr:uncharacterized protein LOC8061417 [Sorghum bicolor]KAG0547027.1 hypothetical protein BDA96_01G043700 [Sorghum bicolor]|eukprot:XP_021316660.1 uncharacterized protein LOC8061417 [Sorghum bicolor]